jgi:hypothetical protein
MSHATDELELTSERTPREEDVRAVHEGLLAFNVARLGDPQHAPVTLFLRDRTGAVVGGLLGHWRWGWLTCVPRSQP